MICLVLIGGILRVGPELLLGDTKKQSEQAELLLGTTAASSSAATTANGRGGKETSHKLARLDVRDE